MRQAERFFILQQIDTLWREHLQQMDALRESVGLRGGQNPLIEYKSEGYELFLDMMINIRRNVVYSLFQFQPQIQPSVQAPSELVSSLNHLILPPVCFGHGGEGERRQTAQCRVVLLQQIRVC